MSRDWDGLLATSEKLIAESHGLLASIRAETEGKRAVMAEQQKAIDEQHSQKKAELVTMSSELDLRGEGMAYLLATSSTDKASTSGRCLKRPLDHNIKTESEKRAKRLCVGVDIGRNMECR